MTTGLLFYAAFSVNNAAIGQQASDSANRTVSLNSAPENEAIVAIPTPSADDLIPETEQPAGTKEKVSENSDESNDDNGVRGKVEQAVIQKDESDTDQTSEDGQEQLSENEEKEDNSDAREEENDNDDDESEDDDNEDVPFVLPFP